MAENVNKWLSETSNTRDLEMPSMSSKVISRRNHGIGISADEEYQFMPWYFDNVVIYGDARRHAGNRAHAHIEMARPSRNIEINVAALIVRMKAYEKRYTCKQLLHHRLSATHAVIWR